MTELVDRSIAALRTNHDTLAILVPGLSKDVLTGPSGASEWSVARVLSHLGSGAELMLVPVTAAVDGTPVPEHDNQAVWDRWDALGPVDQAAGFLEHDARLVETLERLGPAQRASLRVDLGFLPEPAPLSTVVGMRLNEAAQHGWDVRVGLDPAAGLDPESAVLLAEHYAGDLSFLLGFIGKGDQLSEPTRIAVGDFGIVVNGQVSVATRLTGPTATFEGPLEAAVRLLTGRLKPEHTPEGVEVTGNVTLDDLRKVFPGY
jgi:uncharacterized protein (TIGR03083 family)